MNDELSDDKKKDLERELIQTEQTVNEIGQGLVDQGLLKKAPLSLSESIRQKLAEKQKAD